MTAPPPPPQPTPETDADDDRSTWRAFVGCTTAMVIAAVLATLIVWLAWQR